jgi:hypothetical protein
MVAEKMFGRRKVVSSYRNRWGKLAYVVECECGRRDTLSARAAEKRRADVCRPCYKREWHAEQGSVYGRFPAEDRKLLHSLRTRFCAIRYRCDGNSYDRKWYGDRGIECRFTDAIDFLGYVLTLNGARDRRLEIDRIDNDGHYERGNIRFVTHKENTNNKRHGGGKRKVSALEERV